MQIADLRAHIDQKLESTKIGIYSHITSMAQSWGEELKDFKTARTSFLERALWLLLGAAVTIGVNLITK